MEPWQILVGPIGVELEPTVVQPIAVEPGANCGGASYQL